MRFKHAPYASEVPSNTIVFLVNPRGINTWSVLGWLERQWAALNQDLYYEYLSQPARIIKRNFGWGSGAVRLKFEAPKAPGGSIVVDVRWPDIETRRNLEDELGTHWPKERRPKNPEITTTP